MKNDSKLLAAFGLDRHRLHRLRVAERLAVGKSAKGGSHVDHCAARAMFYHCDLPSMFQDHSGLRDLFQRASQDALAAEKLGNNPYDVACSEEGTVAQKVNAVWSKYLLSSFR